MSAKNRIEKHLGNGHATVPFISLVNQQELNARKAGYAWSSFLRSWNLFLEDDEMINLSGLFNIASLSVKKPKKGPRAKRIAKIKRKRFTLKNESMWAYDEESAAKAKKVVYASMELGFFWCAIQRLREESNIAKVRERYVLRKLKQKGIVHHVMDGKPLHRRYLAINSIQLDHYLQIAESLFEQDENPEPGTKYITWEDRVGGKIYPELVGGKICLLPRG